jgi:hypothetical protein
MNVYEIGQTVILRAVFKNKAGVAVDPTALTMRIKDPLGAVTAFTYGVDPEVVKESDGNYYIARDPNLQGVYVALWEGTGSNKGAAKDHFQMAESFFD